MRDSGLRGIVAASLTPVTEDLEIDVARLAEHVSGLLDQGCSFVSTFGTTGEGASFSVGQKLAALEGLAAAGIEMGRLMPGVMSSSIDAAARNLAGLERLGCRSAVVLPPYYFGAGNAGVADFFDALFRRAGGDIGVILYNIPQLSRVAFDRDLIRCLIDSHGPRIAGLKDSTGSRENAVMLAGSFPELSIFVGDDRVLPDLLAAGGAGLIGGLPNLFTGSSIAFYQSPQGARATELIEQAKLRIEAIIAGGDLLALKGTLARYRDDPAWGRTMPPLTPIAEERVTELLQVFASTGYKYKAVAA